MVRTKILAMILAVAMVVAIVPAFGLVASAAEAPVAGGFDDDLLEKMIVKAPNIVDYSGSHNYNDANISNWGWTPYVRYQVTINLRTYDGHDTLQIYNAENNPVWYNGKNAVTSKEVQEATANKDYMVIEFLTHNTVQQDYTVTLYSGQPNDEANNTAGNKWDAPDANTAFLKFAYGVSGIRPSTLPSQYEVDEQALSANFAESIAPNQLYVPVRAYIAKTADGSYDIIWRVQEDGVWKTKYTVNGLPAENVANGFTTLRFYFRGNNWQHIGFSDLKIYAGNYDDLDSIVNVTATYKYNEDTITTKTLTYDKRTNPEGATFPALDYSADGSNVLYHADEQVLTDSKDIDMEVVANPDVADFTNGKTITVDGKRYTIASDNLIPNGDFSEGFAGWFDCSNYGDSAVTATAANFEILGDGTVKALDHTGNAGAGSLYRTWAIETGKTYAITFYDNSHNEYHVVSLSNELGEEKKEDTGIYGTAIANADNKATKNPTDNTQNTAVFTNDSYKYIKIRFRWNDGKNNPNIFGRFGLYEVEEMAVAVPTKVTVEGHDDYVLYEGNVFEGETETAQISEKKFAFDGKIYKVAAQTVELTAEKAEVAVEATVEQEYAATKVAHDPASPGGQTTVGGYVAVAGKDDNMSDADGVNLTDGSITAYGNARYMDMTFNTPNLEEGQVAILHIAAGGTRNNNGSGKGSIRLRIDGNGANYAYTTTAWTDADNNDTAFSTPEYRTADITDIVKAASGETFSVKLATGRGAVGLVNEAQSGWNGVAEGYASYIEIVDGVKVTVEGAADGALITKDGAVKSTSFYALEGDTVRVYNGANNKSGLANTSVNGAKADATAKKVLGVDTTITVVAAPEQAKVELGWTGAKFAFLVTSANATDIVAGEENWAIGEGYNGVAVVPTDTNAIYEFKGSNNGLIEGAAAEKVSIYSLVAAELATWNSADSVKEEQLDEVVNVISNGGLYIENKKLNAQADMIFDLDEATGEITLDEKLANSGIKIKGIKYAINSIEDPENDIKDATIEGDTIKIPGWENLFETSATIIFLEDVEFVFDTSIGESVADETITGELDFVEEV